MTEYRDSSGEAHRWSVRPRTDEPAHGAPGTAASLHDELTRIEHRVDAVLRQGREAFHEGSDSYDRATVAVLRLAALFEGPGRYGPLLTIVTEDERRGILTTRNIPAHSGYAAMNTEVFWRTVTERLPEVIARIRAANAL